MPENILIAIAWPYANAEIHVGNITGSHLPGDIVARYHRLKGNNVLVVSGTDSHGTPVTLAADKEGKPVEEVYKKYHDGFIEVFKGYGITYDLFTTTPESFQGIPSHVPRVETERLSFTQNRCNGIRHRQRDSFPIGTSKGPFISAASKAHVRTSATTAAMCSNRKS
jgi:hypothetical protein